MANYLVLSPKLSANAVTPGASWNAGNLSGAVAAGDKLIAVVMVSKNPTPAPVATGITDSLGNVWVKDPTTQAIASDGGFVGEMSTWQCVSLVGTPSNITVAITGTAGLAGISIIAVSGLNSSPGAAGIEISKYAAGSAATADSGVTSGTTTAPNLFKLGLYADQGDTKVLTLGTVDTAYTLGSKSDNNANGETLIEYADSGPTGSTAQAQVGNAGAQWAMAVIVYKVSTILVRGVSTVGPLSVGSPLTINKPAGTVDGDVAFAFVFQDFPGSFNDPTSSSGFTKLFSGVQSPNLVITAWRKVCSGEGATWAWADVSSRLYGAMVVTLRNVDNVTPEDGVAVGNQFNNSTTPTALGGTTSVDNAWMLAAYATWTATALTKDASAIELIATFGSAGDLFRMDRKQISPAGATGTLVATQDVSDQWVAGSIFVRPAGPAAAPAAGGSSVLDAAPESILGGPWMGGPIVQVYGDTTITPTAVGDVDSGTGTESFTVLGLPLATDSGAGSESPTVSAAPTATESGAGSESTSITAVVGNAENGAGSEATSTLAVVGLSDSGSGSETFSVTAVISSVDTGTGAEAHSVTATVGPAENGAGSESTSTLAVVGLGDSASGGEAVTTTGSVPATEDGVGTEATSITISGGTTTPSDVDSGVGTESVYVTITGVIGPPLFHEGQPYPRIRHPHIGPTRFVDAFDGGVGSDQYFTTATVTVFDSGVALDPEFTVSQLVNVADTATGRDYPDTEKFEDEDSERRTLIFLASQGAITLEELAILLMGKEF